MICGAALPLRNYLNFGDDGQPNHLIHKQDRAPNWQVRPDVVMYLLVASCIAPNANDLLLRQY